MKGLQVYTAKEREKRKKKKKQMFLQWKLNDLAREKETRK